MMSDERKQRQLVALGKKEASFLRLKRTKMGLNDFRTVKVIGKGAFGEVSFLPYTQALPDHAQRLL
jgi:protein-serine/threonine kinase